LAFFRRNGSTLGAELVSLMPVRSIYRDAIGIAHRDGQVEAVWVEEVNKHDY